LKFLIDNAVSHMLAIHLRGLGHDAVHVRDYKMHAAEDEVVLSRAALEKRMLITKDTDFGDLLAGSGSAEPSVILFRRTSGEPDTQFELLRRILPYLEESLRGCCIIVIEPRKVRIRKLPIGNPEA
jgi:predicted nuclease of predicted toxin-antitoxin system